MPLCQICDREFSLINNNHLKTHDTTLTEYIKEYGNPNTGRTSTSPKDIAKKMNKKKKFTHHQMKTIDEIYELEKTIVVPDKFICVMEENKEKLDEAIRLAYQYKSISVDTETTGLDPFEDKITDLIITIHEPTYCHNYFIPMGHVDREDKIIPGQLTVDYVKDKVRAMLEDSEIEKAYFLGYFDLLMIWCNWGYLPRGIAWDGLIGGHILNENERSHKMKDLYGKYLQDAETDPQIKALGVETYEEQFGKIKFYRVPLKVATCYGGKDGYMTRKLREFQQPYIDKIPGLSKVFYEVELPLVEELVKMRKEGIGVDLEFNEKVRLSMQEELEKDEKYISDTLGDINLRSPQQVAKALFDDLGLPEIEERSTKASVLERLEERGYEVAGVLINYKKKQKLLGTYLETMPSLVKKQTGRVHCRFNQSGPKTGRFSSSDPNLQNVPTKDPRLRQIYIARPGNVLISADFSQIEPRILAHISEDPTMIQAYREGHDIYSSMAAGVFSMVEEREVTIEECGDGTSYRKQMKTLLLGMMYSMSSKGLSGRLGIKESEAKRIMDSFFNHYPNIRKHIRDLKVFCKEHGYVSTLDGRKRRLTSIWSDEWWERKKAERQLLNAEIQGTAADIMKRALYKVSTDQRITILGGKLLLTVHDELISEAPYETAIEVSKYMIEDMSGVVNLKVPMSVDAEISVDGRWYGKTVDLIKEEDDYGEDGYGLYYKENKKAEGKGRLITYKEYKNMFTNF